MPDNKNEIDPKKIQLVKQDMRARLAVCCLGYTASLMLLVVSAHHMKSQEWGLAICFGLLGYLDCLIGDQNLKKYLEIRDALNEYNNMMKNR